MRALATLSVAGLVLLLAACAVVVGVGCREIPGRGDVAVVLGAHVTRDARVSPWLEARLRCGLGVWRAGRAPRLIVSGGPEAGVDEATVMKRWLVAHGVPDSLVIVDSNGVNTWATARFVRGWLEAHRATRVVAVSQHFHLWRTRLALQRWGVDSVATAGPDYVNVRDLYSVPREVAGLVKYALRPAPGVAPLVGEVR